MSTYGSIMLERKRFILEVGTGARPFPTTGERMIETHEYYIGINPGKEEALRLPKTLLRKDSKHTGEHDMFAADGRFLPFTDTSISEILFRNVFDSPDPERREHITTIYIPEDQRKTIQEARRVLKDGGLLVVAQTYTPHRAPFKEIKKLVETEGFVQTNQDELSIYDTRALSEYAFGWNDVNYTKFQDVDWKKHPPYVATFLKTADLNSDLVGRTHETYEV